MEYGVNKLFTIESYTNSLKEGLQQHSDQLIANIKETTKLHYYNKIDLLDFTAFVQSYALSITMFSMDRDASEVFYQGEDSSVFGGSYDLLDEIEYYDIPDEKEDEFWEFYDQNDEVLANIETKAIVEWFADCWNKADGKIVKLPVYFSFHDYDECFDLHKNEWISDGDKWF